MLKSLICEASLCDFNEDLAEMLLVIGQQETPVQNLRETQGIWAVCTPNVAKALTGPQTLCLQVMSQPLEAPDHQRSRQLRADSSAVPNKLPPLWHHHQDSVSRVSAKMSLLCQEKRKIFCIKTYCRHYGSQAACHTMSI